MEFHIGQLVTIHTYDGWRLRVRRRKVTRVAKTFVQVGKGDYATKFRINETNNHDALTEIDNTSTYAATDRIVID